MGRLERIWIKMAHGGRMDAVNQATLVAGRGLRGNANQGGRRRVTLVDQLRWSELMHELDALEAPERRRANLLLSGIDLVETRGRMLRVGTALLRIEGETKPCGQMDEVVPGLQRAMRVRWGGGAFAEVIDGGAIAVGDPVVFAD